MKERVFECYVASNNLYSCECWPVLSQMNKRLESVNAKNMNGACRVGHSTDNSYPLMVLTSQVQILGEVVDVHFSLMPLAKCINWSFLLLVIDKIAG